MDWRKLGAEAVRTVHKELLLLLLFCLVPDNFAFRAPQFSLSRKKCNHLHYKLEHLVPTASPHSVCMRFLSFQQQTAITSVIKTNLFVLIMKEQCVFCKVRTEVL